jgi:hypothetical protein
MAVPSCGCKAGGIEAGADLDWKQHHPAEMLRPSQ